jgi:6-phosphogluconolactonase
MIPAWNCWLNFKKRLLLIVPAAALFGVTALRTADPDWCLMYVGTYTGGESKGIYAYRFQPSSGKTISIGLVAATVNPSFFAVHPNNRFLYAVNETAGFEGKDGSISAFSINPKNGMLTFLNKVSSMGKNPCHLTVDNSGEWLIAANYSSGSVSIFSLKEDGRLGSASMFMQHSGFGKDPRRQKGPHAHSVDLSPDSRFLLVSDLGLDKVMIYRFDSVKGTLAANNPPFAKVSPGAGPRHLSFHPNGRFVYQINELNSTLTAFAYDRERGSLREIETLSTLPQGFSGSNTAAEIKVHPDGTFIYGSNRGHDSIAVFAIKGEKSLVEPVGHVSTQGRTPRHFAIDPTGNYLFAANQDSGEIVVFRINRTTGMLAASGAVLKVPKPVCVVFVPLH